MSQVHEHQIQLRWSDPDSYGHVNHARALSLLEDARLAVAAEAPGVVPGGSRTSSWPRLEVDYLRSSTTGWASRSSVRSWVTRIGTKSFTMRQELVQDDAVAIRLDAVIVLFDMATDSRSLTDGGARLLGSLPGGVSQPRISMVQH